MHMPKISYNDMIMYAVSRVLLNYRELNANTIDAKTMRFFTHVHLGMAVDTPRGLLVPTVFNADTKSLAQIAEEDKMLAEQARSGSINPDLLTGASFTVSNLGAYGVEYYTPVINVPQTGILGIGGITDRIKVVNGEVVPYKAMGLSLTYAHAALDGGEATNFLRDVKVALENFPALLSM